MRRRTFLGSLAVLPAALVAQEGPPQAELVEQSTVPPLPTIALNHLGFRPEVSKTLILRVTPATPKVESCMVEDVVRPFKTQIEMRRSGSDFGPVLIGDLSTIRKAGIYQVTLGVEQWEHSVPFFVRDDVWRRTLPKAVGYYRYQRCGVEVPGVHPACHLDDARRRDNGQHVDLVGGWHDAGDVRKWMDVTMLNGIALLRLRRELPPREGDPTGDQLLEEVRFGNTYFLKMQDGDGRIWHDTAGGLNGDNSDNHWTDNIVGTADDRYVDTHKNEIESAIFVTLEALAAQSYAASDAPYTAKCLTAAQKAWQAWPERGIRTLDLAWWIMAGCELWRATRDTRIAEETSRTVSKLVANQVQSYVRGQHTIRGFWLEEAPSCGKPTTDPFVNLVFSAMPPIALLEFAHTFREHPQSPLEPGDPLRATGLPVWPYDPQLRFSLPLLPPPAPAELSLPAGSDGTATLRLAGRVELPAPLRAVVDVWWLDQYAGGLFLPLRDGTAGDTSYGGGRYLLDTAKGADLGGSDGALVVDLNFLYHPSCRYSSSWQCPLAPRGNAIIAPVRAGERL